MLVVCHGWLMDVSRAVAAVVAELSPGTSAELVWVNPLAGQTYRLETPDGTQFLKLSPKDAPASHDVLLEAERLRWVGSTVPVPTVLATGSDDHFSWMRTSGLPGIPASDPRWRADPRRTARSLGRGVRLFHDALAPALPACPWSWRVTDRVAAHPDSPQAPVLAADAPEEMDLVVSHGDLCAPNILLAEDGSVNGFVDLGKLGVADRASDLGCHVWSLEYNQLGAVVDDFLAAYGLDVNRASVKWYRDFYTVA